MKLQEIFDQFTHGELSQVSIGGQPAGEINENNYPQLISHINLGLTAIYKRFRLKERRLTVPLQEGADTYEFNIDDMLKIEKVQTDAGVEFALNQDGDEYSLVTPTLKSLRVPQLILEQGIDLPDELRTTSLTITYRANHPKLSMGFGFLLPETKVMELPPSHLQALLFYVASRVNNPIGMANEFNAGNAWFARYEDECQRLLGENLRIDTDRTNDRLFRNGWV